MNHRFLSLIAVMLLFAFTANAQFQHLKGKSSPTDAIECPSDATISQALGDESSVSTSNSEAGTSGYLVAQQVTGWTHGDLTSIRVFGGQLYHNGTGWASCTTDPFNFSIVFYADDAGSPGTEISTHTATLSHNSTDVYVFGNATYGYIYYWDWTPTSAIADLPETFWFSFQNDTEDCWFMWANTPGGSNTNAASNDGTGWTAAEAPYQFCLTGTPLPTNTVTFNVDDGTDALEGATVTIDGTDLTTDASGVATIDLVDGDYPYTVSLAGYEDETGSTTVSGAAVTVDVSMTALPTYTVTFTVTDNDGGAEIEGASIAVDGQTLTTNASGVATIDLIDGTYAYTVSATDYNDVSADAVVNGADLDVPVGMDLNGISELAAANINIYPNPSNGKFNIETKDSYEVNVMNIAGKVVYSTAIKGNSVIDLSNESSGVYFIQLKSDNQVINHRIMIK